MQVQKDQMAATRGYYLYNPISGRFIPHIIVCGPLYYIIDKSSHTIFIREEIYSFFFFSFFSNYVSSQ